MSARRHRKRVQARMFMDPCLSWGCSLIAVDAWVHSVLGRHFR